MLKGRHIQSLRNVILVLLFLFFLGSSQGHALDATFAWDASPAADYYEVYFRTSSGNYSIHGTTTFSTYNFTGLPDQPHYFAVKAVNTYGISGFSREVCVLDSQSTDPYDKGWAITSGDLKGFMVFYNDTAPNTPTLGPSDAILPLHQDIPDVQGIGLPLNLQPSGTNFTPDNAKIFIPCPGYSNVSGLYLYYYDDVDGWMLAEDANPTWIEPGSRVNHNNGNPSTIEVQVRRFSGAQAGAPSGSQGAWPDGYSGMEGAGGCFVDTLLPAHCH